MDETGKRVADWLDGAAQSSGSPPPEIYACVEVFGHRKHYGRIKEVDRFGAKMLRVDVPTRSSAPLLGEDEQFETFIYGGSAIFSLTPMTEEAARKWAEAERPKPYRPLGRLPAPGLDDDDDDPDRPF